MGTAIAVAVDRISIVNRPPMECGNTLLAFADVTLNGVFLIRDCRLVKGANRTFVSMPCIHRRVRSRVCGHKVLATARFCHECGIEVSPSPKKVSQPFKDVCFPLTAVFRFEIESAVIRAYEAKLDEPLSPRLAASTAPPGSPSAAREGGVAWGA